MGARKIAMSFFAVAGVVALGVAVPVAAQAETSETAQSTRFQPPTGSPGPEAVAAAKAATKTASVEGVSTANSCWNDAWPFGDWWCNNAPGAALLYEGAVVGHVETDPSIFSCRAEFPDSNHGGPHPTRWEWTQADDTGSWGWMSDNDIASETDTLPEC